MKAKDYYLKHCNDWLGCHWSTDFGILKLNLSSVSSLQAQNLVETIEATIKESIQTAKEMCEESGHKFSTKERAQWASDLTGIPVNNCNADTIINLAVDCWRDAHQWLARVELDAEQARICARSAIDMIASGEFDKALLNAKAAKRIEDYYGHSRSWCKFPELVEQEIKEIQNTKIRVLFDPKNDLQQTGFLSGDIYDQKKITEYAFAFNTVFYLLAEQSGLTDCAVYQGDIAEYCMDKVTVHGIGKTYKDSIEYQLHAAAKDALEHCEHGWEWKTNNVRFQAACIKFQNITKQLARIITGGENALN